MPRPDPVVLVKGTGGAGLGDLIRALLAGLHYAAISRRGLVPCWDDGLYGPPGQDVFPRLLRLVGIPSPPLAEVDPASVWPVAWRGRLHLPLGQVYALERTDDWHRSWALASLSFDPTRFDYPESTLVMWEFDRLPASWAAAAAADRLGASPDAALRRLARRHLRPAAEVLERVRTLHDEQFAPRMIGVHVRKTFETGGATRHVDLGALFALLDRLRRGRPGRGDETGIFLATDNQEVEAQFRARYPRVASTTKWFGAAGVALHFNDRAPDKTQVAIEALVDLYLLAACDALIHPSESSFSRVAALLGNIPPQRVYGMPPGSPGWRRRLREGWWTLRARADLARATGEPPYFLQP